MPNKNLVSHKNKIDSLIDRIDKYSKTDFNIELLSDLSKYACIQVSGYFEKAIFYMLYDYSTRHSDKKIQSFTFNRLKIVKHPKYNEIKGSINSLIKERNHIAHGEDSSISLSRLIQYYRNAQILIIFIDSLLS